MDRSGVFKCAHDRRPDRHDPAATPLCFKDQRRSRPRNLIRFVEWQERVECLVAGR
jgi:hypothetical protein